MTKKEARTHNSRIGGHAGRHAVQLHITAQLQLLGDSSSNTPNAGPGANFTNTDRKDLSNSVMACLLSGPFSNYNNS